MPHRVNRYTRYAALVLAAASWHASVRARPAPAPPDLVLLHGRIHTLDKADRVVEAIAIRNGTVMAAGSDRQIAKLADASTRRIDLKGRTATPGLIDTHAHIAEGGLDELYHVHLSDVTSVGEAMLRVKAGLAGLKAGQWLQGDGWDEGKLAERRYINAADLDAVAPDNPVFLMHTTGHYGVANSAALRLAHIDDRTANPPAGTIDRDTQGAATGVLKEAAMDAVVDLIPPPTAEQQRAAILASMDEMHREGMTAVKDPSITRPVWDAYRGLLEEGKLKMHVCVLWFAGSTLDSARAALATIEALPKPPQSLGDGNLMSCGAKIFMDGSGGARTAWMSHDWNKKSVEIDAGNTGYPKMAPEVYRQMVRLFHQAGIHVGTHAIGDRAIDWVVDTYAQVLAEKPTRHLRHSIIHANIPSEHAIATMHTLQTTLDSGYPEVQAPFMWWLGDTYAANFGEARSQRLVPLHSYLSHGVEWGGGSDYPVTPLPARYGLWASVERETLQGTYGAHPFGTAEAVDVRTALRSYTSWAARQLFMEKHIGSLDVGKDADIAVWDRDMFNAPPGQLKDLKCELTLVHGAVVYRAGTP